MVNKIQNFSQNLSNAVNYAKNNKMKTAAIVVGTIAATTLAVMGARAGYAAYAAYADRLSLPERCVLYKYPFQNESEAVKQCYPFGEVISPSKAFTNSFKSDVNTMVTAAKDASSAVVNAVASIPATVSSAASSVKEAVVNTPTAASNAFSAAKEAASNAFSATKETVVNTFSATTEKVSSTVSSSYNAILNSTFVGNLGVASHSIAQGFKNAFNAFFETRKDDIGQGTCPNPNNMKIGESLTAETNSTLPKRKMDKQPFTKLKWENISPRFRPESVRMNRGFTS